LTMTTEMIDSEDDVLDVTETRTAVSKSVVASSFPVDDGVVGLRVVVRIRVPA
jgi:hypothetical protein